MIIKFSKFHLTCCCILMLTCNSLSTSAQGTAQLDSVKNISLFKFGADTSGIRHLIADTVASRSFKNVDAYQYTGDSLKTFFDVPVSKVRVYYYKNQLFRVDVDFGRIDKEYTLEEFNQVQDDLIKRYGIVKGRLAMSGALMLGGGRWEGKNIMLDHTRHSYPQKRKKHNAIYGQVSFHENALSRLQVADQYGKPRTK